MTIFRQFVKVADVWLGPDVIHLWECQQCFSLIDQTSVEAHHGWHFPA